MRGIVISCVFLSAMSVMGIVFPELFWRAGSWRYRNAKAMEPTTAQYNLYRARFGALLTLSVPTLIGVGWPGSNEAKVSVWATTAIGSVAVYLAILILLAVTRAKRVSATIDHNRPSELSEAGYGEQWFILGYTLFASLLIAGVMYGTIAGQAQREDRRANEQGPTDEQIAEMTKNISEGWPTFIPPTVVEHPELPVFSSLPENLVVLDATQLQVNADGVARVGAPLNACPMAGLVVIESSVNVSFGVAYDATAANGVDPATFCKPMADPNTLEFISVPIDLGTRATLTLSGSKLTHGKY